MPAFSFVVYKLVTFRVEYREAAGIDSLHT
jgi:hypothetical protein